MVIQSDNNMVELTISVIETEKFNKISLGICSGTAQMINFFSFAMIYSLTQIEHIHYLWPIKVHSTISTSIQPTKQQSELARFYINHNITHKLFEVMQSIKTYTIYKSGVWWK